MCLSHQLFNRSVLLVPNCYWTGFECDLLGVTKDLRLIDIEIKISRSDLKADVKKEKWWVTRPWSRTRNAINTQPYKPGQRVWPDKVWKHYYAMPEEVWDDSFNSIISPASGVVLLRRDARYFTGTAIRLLKRAKPDKNAKQITTFDVIDLARLANLRMWSALNK